MLRRNFNHLGLIDECELKCRSLFADDASRQAFLSRLADFIASDESLRRITRLGDSSLFYESESLAPADLDPSKPSLFFVVGNPEPGSVARRAMYAYEGGGTRQHRFWKVLHRTAVLRFSQLDPDAYSPAEKMRLLFAGKYESPFNVHIVPFFSLP